MGKAYVIAIAVAAPSAILLGVRGFTTPMMLMAWVQGVLWLLCTALAFVTARNRQIAVHRQWMIRSYAFTLNFIFSRVLNPIPAYFNMSESGLALTLALLSMCYFLIPEVAFDWKELTHRRA